MGIVEEVRSRVTTIKQGDRVIAPFAFSDGTCEFCRKGLYTNCLHGGVWGQAHDGGQAEAICAIFADATLVVVPKSVEGDEALLKAILPLADVMGTGHYAAVLAGVHPRGTVAIVGDGAVGLCGVLAARRLGAERIILLGHQAQRLELGRRFGATDLITCSGDGVPHGSEQLNLERLFFGTIALRGGSAPVRAFLRSCSQMCWPDSSILLLYSISPSILMALR
jgi:threonine dehydrogenase-like Zn-dependent dehydrogenase